MKIIERISKSFLIQLLINIVLYSFYAAVLGLSLFPSVLVICLSFAKLIQSGGGAIPQILLFAVIAGASVYLFFICSIVIMGLFIRLMSLGVKEGVYRNPSFTLLRWLMYSGIYNMMVTMVLPVIPMSFFSNFFFRLIGCRIGKNVWINSWMLNDAYLLTIDDNVIIGGQTDISCHLFENNRLILKKIHIGEGSVIGAHCYISPGVKIGKGCVIGLGCYIRQDKEIPDYSKITSISNVSIKTARKIEKGDI